MHVSSSNGTSRVGTVFGPTLGLFFGPKNPFELPPWMEAAAAAAAAAANWLRKEASAEDAAAAAAAATAPPLLTKRSLG